MNHDYLYTNVSTDEFITALKEAVSDFNGAVTVELGDNGNIGVEFDNEDGLSCGFCVWKEGRHWEFRKGRPGGGWVNDWVLCRVLNDLSVKFKAKLGCEAFDERWNGKPNKFKYYNDYIKNVHLDRMPLVLKCVMYLLRLNKLPKPMRHLYKKK